jgi:hypothetical protein
LFFAVFDHLRVVQYLKDEVGQEERYEEGCEQEEERDEEEYEPEAESYGLYISLYKNNNIIKSFIAVRMKIQKVLLSFLIIVISRIQV